MGPPDISLAVVGADYLNKRGPTRRFELAMCTPGETVLLVLEPENPKDENAVAVYSCRDVQIGYLSAERAPRIRQLILQGSDVKAIFQSHERFGGYIRVSFDGNDPVLPPVFDSDPDPDFFPDPIYDDD
jgi:hypothetical protein